MENRIKKKERGEDWENRSNNNNNKNNTWREEDKNNTWKEEKIRFGNIKAKKYIWE